VRLRRCISQPGHAFHQFSLPRQRVTTMAT
jgi:hypothetical protein